METLRFFTTYLVLTMGRLHRQLWLTAGLALLCLALPLGAGRAAQALLTRGVDFRGVTLAVTAPEGDPTPARLAEYMNAMEDIAQYCRMEAMGEDEALEALERGEVTAVLALPIPLHYALSLLCYFALSAAPLFMPVYTGNWLRFQRRLRGAGRSCAAGFFSGVAAGVPLLLLLLFPALLAAGEGRNVPALLGAAAVMAVFCSLFGALCCLAAGSAGRCGAAAFLVSLLSLMLAGGIVPPALLPRALQELGWLSPVSWLRQTAAWAMGHEAERSGWVCLALAAAGMAAGAFALYRREADREEAEE